jgi:hypothetical protein
VRVLDSWFLVQYSKIPNNVIKFDINEQKFPKYRSFTGAGGSVGGSEYQIVLQWRGSAGEMASAKSTYLSGASGQVRVGSLG